MYSVNMSILWKGYGRKEKERMCFVCNQSLRKSILYISYFQTHTRTYTQAHTREIRTMNFHAYNIYWHLYILDAIDAAYVGCVNTHTRIHNSQFTIHILYVVFNDILDHRAKQSVELSWVSVLWNAYTLHKNRMTATYWRICQKMQLSELILSRFE